MGERVLLREWEALPKFSSQVVKESRETNGGKLIVSGIMQRADVPNHNKRIYPRRLLTREMENFSKSIRENRALGECDHPETSTVSLMNSSHVIREAWWDGNTVMGKIEILSTPAGKVIETLIESGITVGISSRGVGSTTKNESTGTDMVEDDFTLVTFDMVAEPSTDGAYMMKEAIERVMGKMTKADKIFRALNALKEWK